MLLHGLSGSTRWWARNIPELAQQVQVIAIDLIGFGESRGGRPFILSDAAGYLVRWLDRLGIERAHVAGHSMGGFIAADLAARHPRRVGRLILIDAAIFPPGGCLARHAVGLARSLRATPVDFLPILVGDSLHAGPQTIWNAASQLVGTDIRPMLARVQAPTLIVWGEDDALTPPEIGQSLVRAIPDARLVTILHAGHNPMWERPAAFNQAVLDFLTVESRSDRSAKRDREHEPGRISPQVFCLPTTPASLRHCGPHSRIHSR